jgi:hypothetical protein
LTVMFVLKKLYATQKMLSRLASPYGLVFDRSPAR